MAAVMAQHFNDARGAAWPASRTIASLVRMDRKNIRRALRSLAARGFLVRVDGRFRSSAFALAIPQQEGVVQPPQRGSYNPLKGGPATPSKGVVQPPEYGVRSEAVGIRNPAASARAAGAARARGGHAGKRGRRDDTPTSL